MHAESNSVKTIIISHIRITFARLFILPAQKELVPSYVYGAGIFCACIRLFTNLVYGMISFHDHTIYIITNPVQ